MIEKLDNGAIGLIQQEENGDIVQIGLTDEQSLLLQAFLTYLSKETAFVKLPSEYNLFLLD